MWWTADPPRPFQLRPVPISSALRFLVAGLPPAFIYRRVSRLSQGIAFSYRVTLMVRPLLLAEPGPGDASCTIWTLSVFFHPLHLQAGRPSGRLALRSFPVSRPSPYVSGLTTFSVRFRSYDLLRSSCDPNLAAGGFHVTGDLNYSWEEELSKPKKWHLECISQRVHE